MGKLQDSKKAENNGKSKHIPNLMVISNLLLFSSIIFINMTIFLLYLTSNNNSSSYKSFFVITFIPFSLLSFVCMYFYLGYGFNKLLSAFYFFLMNIIVFWSGDVDKLGSGRKISMFCFIISIGVFYIVSEFKEFLLRLSKKNQKVFD